MSIKEWLNKNKSDGDSNNTSSPNVAITLEDITRGMQYAATSANTLIAHQYMKSLEPFFEPTESGSLVPKTIEMQIDEKHHFKLPLVALATPRGLMLDEMKVHLTVRTDLVEQQTVITQENQDTLGHFHVSLSPSSQSKGGRDSQHVDIEMHFKVLDPPESVMRLIDEYTNRILPQSTQNEGES